MEVSSGRMAGDEVLAFFQPQAVPADCRAQLQHQLAFKRILVGNQKETVEFKLQQFSVPQISEEEAPF